MLLSVLQLFNLHMNEKVLHPLKIKPGRQSLEEGLLCRKGYYVWL